MKVVVSILGDDAAAELPHLFRWLDNDRKLSEQAAVDLRQETQPGDMGSLDVIEVVLAQAIALGQLALAVATWRATRPTRPVVRLDQDGNTTDIDDDPPADGNPSTDGDRSG